MARKSLFAAERAILREMLGGTSVFKI